MSRGLILFTSILKTERMRDTCRANELSASSAFYFTFLEVSTTLSFFYWKIYIVQCATFTSVSPVSHNIGNTPCYPLSPTALS